MKIIVRADTGNGDKYLITNDDEATAPYDGDVLVQMVLPGGLVSPTMLIGSLTAHDPYTDWQLVDNPPPLAQVLANVTKWPEGDLWMPGMEPFLTQEVGEKIIADAAGAA